MTAFTVLALLMALAAIVAVALPLWRHRTPAQADDEATLAVYRERDAELTRERERGNLDEQEYAEAREELERELLAATAADGSGPRPATGRPTATLVVVAVAVPAVAVVTYLATGMPGLLGKEAARGLSPAQVEQFRAMGPEQRIARLEPLVERQPGATRAWILLAQAYRASGRYGDAVNAYARVRAQGDPDPWLLARQAEALLLANGRRFTASVEDLVEQALELDDSNPLALMLAGHAAQSRGDAEQAVVYWQRLAEDMPADSQNRAMLDRLIARARGEEPADRERREEATATANADPAPTSPSGADSGPSLTVRVALAPELANAAPANTPVFIFARAAGESGGAPLAVQRTTVAALPGDFTLTDAQAMTPNRKLSGASRVKVTARASLSGGVMPQSGDLQGSSQTVEVGPDIRTRIRIDRRIP